MIGAEASDNVERKREPCGKQRAFVASQQQTWLIVTTCRAHIISSPLAAASNGCGGLTLYIRISDRTIKIPNELRLHFAPRYARRDTWHRVTPSACLHSPASRGQNTVVGSTSKPLCRAAYQLMLRFNSSHPFVCELRKRGTRSVHQWLASQHSWTHISVIKLRSGRSPAIRPPRLAFRSGTRCAARCAR